MWKHRIGPGWGSFAVVGNRLFTQEQRGADEVVVCSRPTPAWKCGRTSSRHASRRPSPGPGRGPRRPSTATACTPRAATGKLVCLDAATGNPRWTADLVADAGGVVPQWGYSGSPLFLGGTVVAYAGGPDGKGTVGYDADTGNWCGRAGRRPTGTRPPSAPPSAARFRC